MGGEVVGIACIVDRRAEDIKQTIQYIVLVN